MASSLVRIGRDPFGGGILLSYLINSKALLLPMLEMLHLSFSGMIDGMVWFRLSKGAGVLPMRSWSAPACHPFLHQPHYWSWLLEACAAAKMSPLGFAASARSRLDLLQAHMMQRSSCDRVQNEFRSGQLSGGVGSS